jgi:glycosyltransferase involved in cell wall biosynthesis
VLNDLKTRVTIGLCVKNGSKVVKTAFDSISIQDYPHEFLKLVIVDDGSTDNTLSLAKEFSQKTDITTFITSSNGKGLGATRQIAADNAEGDYILWIDDDLVFAEDFIRKQVDFMEENPNMGAAQGIAFKTIPQATIFNIVEARNIVTTESKTREIGCGGTIFRLKALQGVGGFDITIKGAGEDVDVTRRIKKSGWAIAPNNLAQQRKGHPPATLKALWRKSFWYGYANHFIYHKYKNSQMLIKYFPPIVLVGGIKSSIPIYQLINRKKVLVFPVFHYFIMLAEFFGFISSHKGGYGHIISS